MNFFPVTQRRNFIMEGFAGLFSVVKFVLLDIPIGLATFLIIYPSMLISEEFHRIFRKTI